MLDTSVRLLAGVHNGDEILAYLAAMGTESIFALDRESLEPLLRIWRTCTAADHAIPAGAVRGADTVLPRQGEGPVRPTDQDRGWRELTQGRITVHDVPGNHITMCALPHVRAVAEPLQTLLTTLRHSRIILKLGVASRVGATVAFR